VTPRDRRARDEPGDADTIAGVEIDKRDSDRISCVET
jgi:hypothetical protein